MTGTATNADNVKYGASGFGSGGNRRIACFGDSSSPTPDSYLNLTYANDNAPLITVVKEKSNAKQLLGNVADSNFIITGPVGTQFKTESGLGQTAGDKLNVAEFKIPINSSGGTTQSILIGSKRINDGNTGNQSHTFIQGGTGKLVFNHASSNTTRFYGLDSSSGTEVESLAYTISRDGKMQFENTTTFKSLTDYKNGVYASGTASNYFRGRVYFKDRLKCFADDQGNVDSFSITTNEGSSSNGGMVFLQNAAVSSKPWLQQFRINGSEAQISGKGIEFRAGPSTETQRGSITFNNTGGVSFNETSDYRTKTNVQPLPSVADIVKSLNPVSYSRAGCDNIKGFIAHELQEHVPQAVTGTKDEEEAIGTLADYDGTVLETEVTEPGELEYTEEVETDGVSTMVTRTRTWTPSGTRPVYQGIDQTKLIPLLTKALQEVMQKNEDLEARIAALEG